MNKKELLEALSELSEDDINKVLGKIKQKKGSAMHKTRGRKPTDNKRKSKKFTKSREIYIGDRPNLFFEFKDNKGNKIADLDKEKPEIASKLYNRDIIPRVREIDLIDVVCSVCGIEETVSSSLVEEISRYKCNNCYNV